MMVFDQRQQEMLENMELEILDFVSSAPIGQAMDDLKRELEHFGFCLGST
jgi:virulence-associated protein VapD